MRKFLLLSVNTNCAYFFRWKLIQKFYDSIAREKKIVVWEFCLSSGFDDDKIFNYVWSTLWNNAAHAKLYSHTHIQCTDLICGKGTHQIARVYFETAFSFKLLISNRLLLLFNLTLNFLLSFSIFVWFIRARSFNLFRKRTLVFYEIIPDRNSWLLNVRI